MPRLRRLGNRHSRLRDSCRGPDRRPLGLLTIVQDCRGEFLRWHWRGRPLQGQGCGSRIVARRTLVAKQDYAAGQYADSQRGRYDRSAHRLRATRRAGLDRHDPDGGHTSYPARTQAGEDRRHVLLHRYFRCLLARRSRSVPVGQWIAAPHNTAGVASHRGLFSARKDPTFRLAHLPPRVLWQSERWDSARFRRLSGVEMPCFGEAQRDASLS